MNFLKNLKLDDNESKTAGHQQDRGLFGKVGGVLQSQIQPHASSQQPTATSGHGALLNKIGDALGHPPTPLSAPAPEKHNEGLLGKPSDTLSDHKPATEPRKEEGLLGGMLGKLGTAIGKKHDEPQKPQTIGDKINHALGGGAAGEQKEDALDKAVDFFQEHVLHQGPQNNESAIEQLKDKQIADAIKHQFKSVTGKDLLGTGRK